jgi:hypothetical protein
MELTPAKIGLYAVVLFGGGAATGVFGHMLFSANTVIAKVETRSNDDWRKRFTDSMKLRLNLSPEQMSRLNDVLDETRVEYRLMRNRYKPEMEKIHLQQVDKIKGFLKPEQMGEFEKMEQERAEKMRVRESGPGL